MFGPVVSMERREYLKNQLKGNFVTTALRGTADNILFEKALYGFEFKEDALIFKMFWGQ